MERSFAKEVQALRLGDGEVFHGEGILAITKGLLQSGVSYVGGYQGAPVSHMMDVLSDAQELLDEQGIHFEICASGAAAAAMCATEKAQMGDGRFDASRILAAARELAAEPILHDFAAIARARTGAWPGAGCATDGAKAERRSTGSELTAANTGSNISDRI